MYKLIFFVPREHKESVKNALFDLGLGRFKSYEHCAFETSGVGQFKPLGSAKPHIGKPGKLETVEEFRVEMLCKKRLIKDAIKTLKATHPYEEVAYELIKIKR